MGVVRLAGGVLEMLTEDLAEAAVFRLGLVLEAELDGLQAAGRKSRGAR